MNKSIEELFKETCEKQMKVAMVERGATLKSLARKTGYSYEGVRQILKGRGSYWGVFKVCRALDIDMKTLIES